MILDLALIDVLLALILIIMLWMLFGMKLVIRFLRGIISMTSGDCLSDTARKRLNGAE